MNSGDVTWKFRCFVFSSSTNATPSSQKTNTHFTVHIKLCSFVSFGSWPEISTGMSVPKLCSQTYTCLQRGPSATVYWGWESPTWCCRRDARKPGRRWRCMWSSWRPLDGPVTPWRLAAYNRTTTPPLNWHSIVPRTKDPATVNTSVTLHNPPVPEQLSSNLLTNCTAVLTIIWLRCISFTAGIFNLLYARFWGCEVPFWRVRSIKNCA